MPHLKMQIGKVLAYRVSVTMKLVNAGKAPRKIPGNIISAIQVFSFIIVFGLIYSVLSRAGLMAVPPVQSQRPYAEKGPVLGLSLCCYHLEILNNSETKDPTLTFFIGPRIFGTWSCPGNRWCHCPLLLHLAGALDKQQPPSSHL